MNKQLFFICLMAATSFASLNAAAVEDAFLAAVTFGDKNMAQAIYKFLPADDDFTLDVAKDAYGGTFGEDAAAKDLQVTPQDRQAIQARFETLMTDPNEPGAVLAKEFGAVFTPKK